MGDYSPPSPKGRLIEHVEGAPSDIIARGREIEKLGQQMLDAADTLQRLKDNTFSGGGQQGKAIEALQDKIGDSYSTLKQAGELYHPVGPVIAQYGESLETYKPLIDNTADDCGDLWAAYEALPGDKEGSTTPEAGGGFMGIGGHDADSPEAKQEAADNQAKKQAYDEWENAADRFDTWYDVWEDAFDEASAGVEDKMAGTIKDSFWDDWGDIISVAYEILSWAALVIGVIAIFCTGLGALAAILALGAFLLSAVKFAAGAEGLGQLGLDALSIIPVGKLSNLSKLAHISPLVKSVGKAEAATRLVGVLDKGPISDLYKVAKGTYEAPSLMKRLVGFDGGTVDSVFDLYKGIDKMPWGRVITTSAVDVFAGAGGKGLEHYGRINTITNGAGPNPKFDPIPFNLPSPPSWVPTVVG